MIQNPLALLAFDIAVPYAIVLVVLSSCLADLNNAGVLRLTPIETLTPGEWSQTIAVNLTAPYFLTRAVPPGMKERGGSILNVSSRAAVMGFKDESVYCASKFGLEGLTRALAVELEDLTPSQILELAE